MVSGGGSRDSLPLFERLPVILTVSELNALIRETLEAEIQIVWVAGEVSNLRIPPSGHCYFTLKDSKSQVAAVLFRSYGGQRLFELENGMQVICRGRVSLYAARGDLQIYVDAIEPRGVGALQIAFEQLKERLSREGLFDAGRKRPLPFLPAVIGVVTSLHGAAIRDILRLLQKRFANRTVLIRPTKVQGDGAALEIAQAISEMNEVGGVEVLIVGRGGGSLEDLWAFNEETVARAIFSSNIPVVSAVGHEIDFTIADFVADARAPTPTAAAQMVVPDREKLERAVEHLVERLGRAWLLNLRRNRRILSNLGVRLIKPEKRLREKQLRCDELTLRFTQAIQRTVRDRRQAWRRWTERLLLHHPESWQKEGALRLRREARGLLSTMNGRMDRLRLRVEEVSARMDSLSPLAVLRRGYSIVRKLPEGNVVRRGKSLTKGDEVDIAFDEGEARCRVERSR